MKNVLGAIAIGLGGLFLWRAVSSNGACVPVGPRRVVCLGDSITAHGGYPAALQGLLPAGSGADTLGYPGAGTAAIQGHIGEALAGAPTDLVLLAGANDIASGRKISTSLSNITAMVSSAKAKGVRVILVTLTPWAAHTRYNGAKTSSLVNAIIRMQDLPSVVVVTTDKLGNSMGGLKSEYDSGDGLHLNNAGQAALGKAVFAQAFTVCK